MRPAEPGIPPAAPQPSQASIPTRQLCAAMNLHSGLRDFVLELFLGERHRAWGPNYCVDSTAVLRHAWRARRWQRARDTVLGLTVLALAVLLVFRCWARGQLAVVGAAAAWIVVGAVIRWIMRRKELTVGKVLRWSWRRNGPGRRRILGVVVVLLAALAITAYGLFRALRPEDAVIIAIAAGVVLVIGVLDVFVVVGRARRALGSPVLPREQAPSMSKRMEQRAADLRDGPEHAQSSETALGQVVAYDFENRRDGFLENTFVGSGSSIGQFDVSIDVGRGRTSSGGSRKKPKQVDLLSLHQSLEEITLTGDLPGSWSGYRMYVDGRSLAEVPDLVSHNGRPPHAWLPLERLHDVLTKPTASQRTYLCFQVPVVNWDEQIVLTLFVRADLTGTHLILHIETLILPMMAFAGAPLIRNLPNDWWTHCTRAASMGSTRVWRAAARSFWWLSGDLGRLGARLLSRWRTNYHVDHNRRVNRGAVFSAREKLSEGVVMVHPNAVQDIKRTLSFLMHALRNGLVAYLKDRNVDTSSIDDEIRTVINSQYNKIGELHARNVVFGNKGKAGDTHSPKGDSEKGE